MAGGTFDKGVGKTRPGTYINFQSGNIEMAETGSRGTVVVPIIKSTYGPAGKWLMLTGESPDACMAQLGYSVNDDDENRQMLLIREALKNAATAYVYIVAEGTKASGSIESAGDGDTGDTGGDGNDGDTGDTGSSGGTLTATAKYGGSRGNALAVTVSADPLDGYDVTVSLAGSRVAYYEQLGTIEELIAQDNEYIDFSGSGDLFEVAALNLEGGEDAEATNADVTAWMDAWESIRFNTVCFPIEDESLKAAALTKVKYMRDSMGRGVQVVLPDYAADYEGIINVTNSVKLGDDALTHAEACAWVAGATAGASYVQSLTFREYTGASEIVDPKTHEQSVQADKNSEFFFTISEAGAVVVERDVNSLTTFADGKDETYAKNRVIRVFDTFKESVQNNFPPNKYNNDALGWEIMKGIGQTILKLFEDDGAITNVDYDSDFVVDEERSHGDSIYFDVLIQPVDSAEKLYFSVVTMA